MSSARADPWVIWKCEGKRPEGMIIPQVDDSLGMATKKFMTEESHASRRFETKEININKFVTTFNGILIRTLKVLTI